MPQIENCHPATGEGKSAGALEQRLGHTFADRDLLSRALTHASLTKSVSRKRGARKSKPANNERLEFLGDRVLGLVIADALLEIYPYDAEGRLTDRLVASVKRDALAGVAAKIELGECLKLARGEEGMGGRNNPGILADCVEALIGALYLDGGLETARQFIRRFWDHNLKAMLNPPRDPKMVLQEWAHAHAGQPPVYEIVERTGPSHAPQFNVAVEVEEKGRETAIGGSKRAAEQAAAALLLRKLESQ